MKDFAKSIRVGNAYTKGQVLGEEEGKKYVFGGEINGTYIVHRQPDGKTFSFSSEQEIKDWMRNSKIGNSNVGNKGRITFEDQIVIVKKDGKQVYKGMEEYEPMRKRPWKYNEAQGVYELEGGYTKENVENKKSGNESIDKQEWSFFKGLKKDAEKEVGNADTVSEYNAEIQRLTKKAEQLRRMGQGLSAMEIEKQIEKLGKELRELGNKKAGNAQYGSKEDIISHLDTDLYEIHQRLKQKDESPWRYLSELQKKGYDMGTLSRHNKDIGKIIEKLKTGNETKAEEKFGKVMGEYEEGALKTPQGKTVTDPAQAKAIAYSEADKVDNLKRARNAMNNKK